jgi:hypothetical protein
MKNFSIKTLFSMLFLFFVVAVTLVSCKSANVIPPIKTETIKSITTKEVVHDTVFKTEKDSSYYRAWLECKDGKVVFKEPTNSNEKPRAKQGKYLKRPKITIKDNHLEVDCYAEAQSLYAKWKDTYIKENSSINTEKPILIEKQLTSWQNFEIWSGRIFLLIITGTAIVTVAKKYFINT